MTAELDRTIRKQTIRNQTISWVHFGDLHIQNAQDENYLDFLELIEEVNRHFAHSVDFAFLPGDNADDGTEAQYKLVRQALEKLNLPVQVITGDHDRKGGSLDLFGKYLEAQFYRAVTLKGFRLLFLNALDGATHKDFDFSSQQMHWLRDQLSSSRSNGLRPLVFTHLYPSELTTQAAAVREMIREFQVELVEMGHTHYNELANDGRTIYATTRSTGQIEEGPPGFSITVIDEDVLSWKFKERGISPFVMITSPCDERLITRPSSSTHIVRGDITIRARVWGQIAPQAVSCSIDGSTPKPMRSVQNHWELAWHSAEVADGSHTILVEAITDGGNSSDEISVLVNQRDGYEPTPKSTVDYENAIGAWPAKGILGTELGPNEKGTKGPWPSWRRS